MPGAAAEAFEGRVAALIRADRLISFAGSRSAGLVRMLEQELMAAAGGASRYSLTGADVVLDSNCAYALSLIFNELAANAARHGSLSSQAGRVHVGWHVENGDLVLSWIERGGPPVQRPSSPGFGSLLVAHAAVTLKGCASLLYLPSGLRCDLRVSLHAQWPRRRGGMFLKTPTAPTRTM